MTSKQPTIFPSPKVGEVEWQERMERIHASLDRINYLLRLLKEETR